MHRKAALLAAATIAVALAAAADRTVAQTAGASATQIITLGTRGGPLPSKDRAQSSNLLVVNGTLYLIDAGDGVTRRIVQAGHDFRKVGKIFITHPHSDHTAGLATRKGRKRRWPTSSTAMTSVPVSSTRTTRSR